MSQQLPKFGGITIERKSKVAQSQNPVSNYGTASQHQSNSQPAAASTSDYFDPDNYEEDYDEDAEFAYDEHFQEDLDSNHGRSRRKSPVHLSSEEDLPGNHGDYNDGVEKLNTSDDIDEAFDESEYPPPAPQLPPGITFQRKKPLPQPTVTSLPPKIQLPPGIAFERRPSPPVRHNFSPRTAQLPIAAISPRVPSLRAQRPLQQRIARLSTPPNIFRPRATRRASTPSFNEWAPPVFPGGRGVTGLRSVRPRPSTPKSSPKQNAVALDAQEFLNQLMSKPKPPLSRPIRPPPPLVTRPNINLPRGITVSPRKPVIEEVSVEEDSEEEGGNLTRQESYTQKPFPQLPPGINIERVERFKTPLEPPVAKETPKTNVMQNFKLPPGISLAKKSTGSPQKTVAEVREHQNETMPSPSIMGPKDFDEDLDEGYLQGSFDEEELGEDEEEEGLLSEQGGNEEEFPPQSEYDENVEEEENDMDEIPSGEADGDEAYEDEEMSGTVNEEPTEPSDQLETEAAADEDDDLTVGKDLEENESSFEEASAANSSTFTDQGNPEVMDFESLISSSVINAKSDGNHDDSEKDEMDDSVKNLVEMMTKGEIEGEIEEDKGEEEEDENEEGSGKKAEKRQATDQEEDSDDVPEKKKKDGEEGDEDSDEMIDKAKVSGSHLRKNIREVMDETKLDEATLAAQREEAERLKRVQEQQRIIREVQRQIQKTNNSQKNQSRMLSLLQGTQTSILKTSSMFKPPSPSQSKYLADNVLLKSANGQQTSLSDKVRELLSAPGKPPIASSDAKNLLGMVSSSVTIAPVKKEPIEEEEKKKSVVTLSSDSDDDCVVLSDEDIESEPEEDPTNSGMHTTDKYNVTDEHGRVLVNVGHPPDEQEIFLAPQIARVIKPHQIGGIRFLYDNIIETLDRYNNSPGFGCILAHSMGLGKTLQIVSFSDVFLRHTSGKKILCIMPINTIQNWQAEYNMWIPKENRTEADVRCREFNIYVVNESLKNIHSRGKVILDWHRNGGVLLMGYELFRLLSLKKPIKSKRKRPDELEEERNRGLVDDIYAALVKPGPDLVICDEGHRIKNSHATTSQALKQIKTRRRVVLTGYPLQNNLMEYWCMVDFVRPNYLGSKTEFSNMFERPIQNGQCIDSTPQDIRLMRFRAHVLHSLLEGFVQRRSHAVLQEVLPQKEEYVLLLRFTPFQKKLYDTFMNDVVRTVAVPNPLKAFAVCCKIWNHPDVLYNFLKKKGEEIDLDLEEALPPSGLPPRLPLDFVAPVTNYPTTGPPVALWPKKGPGSRGGKVRTPSKKKATMVQNLILSSKEKPSQPEAALPSMSQFSIQSSSGYGSSNNSNLPTTSSYQQPSSYYPQQQQQQQPVSNNFPYQNNYDSSSYGTQKQFGSDSNNVYSGQQQKVNYNQDQKSFCEQKSFGNEFNSGFSSDFFQGQQQQPFPSSSTSNSFGQSNQFYPASEGSVSSGFDFGQTGDDFHISNFDNGNFSAANSGATAGTSEFPQEQSFWGNSNWPSCSGGTGNYSGGSSSDEFMSPPKFGGKEEKALDFGNGFPNDDGMERKKSMPMMASQTPTPTVTPKFEEEIRPEVPKKEEMPHEWATELFKNYVTGIVEKSSKMEVFFLILTQSVLRQDRMLVFSQSLLTLDLIEEYLQRRQVPGREENWARNRNYFRLDGSTPAMEREKLINEFNANSHVMLFLVSTRAGSLGINLVGANRVIVFDASWNPCHDTQAVCRVYRYGQKKPCYVYRLVMDCCLEKKIYDRQINKQGMADRVVDELNPDAHLSIKEVTNLCWDDQDETTVKDYSELKDKYRDDIIKLLVVQSSPLLSKEPFQHESLLIDRKEKKLSQAEKRLAKRSYELEKQASNQPRNIYQFFPNSQGGRGLPKPIASVKPMQSERFGAMPSRSKWIPAEVWQKQGMSAQEMNLPLDVVIPTNSPDKTSIVLKAGQRVMVLKSPKGIYMQLETGKIIAIRTAFKVGQTPDKADDKKVSQIASSLKNNPNVTITPRGKVPFMKPSSLDKKAAAVNMAASKGRIAVTNKNRVIPVNRKPFSLPEKDRLKIMEKPETELPATVSKAFESQQKGESISGSEKLLVAKEKNDDPLSGFVDPSLDNIQLDFPLNEEKPPDLNAQPLEASGNETTVMTASQDTWSRVTVAENNPPSTAQPTVSNEDKSILPNPIKTEYPYNPGKPEEVKKEDEKTGWPVNQGYPPMDPYGNYYPGYYGYGPPMPGYEGYPYPRNFPPHIVKTEKQDGSTPPPATPSAPVPPPMYPPYPPNPFTYPYNYPPFPAQPPPATAPPTQPKAGESSETAAPFVPPPYTPRPSFPSAPTPGFFPNYPPYRPFPDPNFPYPNYNPYMPYGYPMQGTPPNMPPPQVPPHQPQPGADLNPPPSSTVTTSSTSGPSGANPR